MDGSTTRPRGARTVGAMVVAAALTALLALGSVLTMSASAQTSSREISSGRLTWGVKESFRSYVEGPIAHGRITTTKGASRLGGGEIAFEPAEGSVAADGSMTVRFAGAVRFTGHSGQLDVTLEAPRLVLAADGSGRLEVTRRVPGEATTTVSIADVAAGNVATSGGSVRITRRPVALTAAGTQVFALSGSGFYEEGTALDPVSLDLSMRPTTPDPTTPDPTTPDPTTPDPTTPDPTTPDPTTPDPTTPDPTTPKPSNPPAQTSRSELAWGVKESFRRYVTGPVAKGRVVVSGHAAATASGYVFPQSSTTAEPPALEGTTTYRGSVRFTGHGGELDLTISRPRVVVSGSSARLVVDRSVAGRSAGPLSIATLDLSGGRRSSDAGAVRYTSVPASLTSAGTALFSYEGRAMYPAGTVLDPVSFTIGADAAVTGPGDPSTAPPPDPEPEGSSAESSPVTLPAEPGDQGARPDAGELVWGVRRSFREYVTGPIAHGSISVSGGASSSGGGSAYRFPQTGDARGDDGADYRGSVTFRGHGGTLDLTLNSPSVEIISASQAHLFVKVEGARTQIATLDLAAATRSTQDGATSYAAAPARITAAGSALFSYNGSSFYPAGSALDPVSFVVGSAAPPGAGASSGETTVDSTSPPSTRTTRAPAKRPSALKNGCVARGSALTWGVKESFRSYISGTIANGDWSTTGGAIYRTPSFTWPSGEGTFAKTSRRGEVTFDGTVNFTGHDGALDTTMADPTVSIDGNRALVSLDVSSTTMEAAMEGREERFTKKDVPFVEVDLSSAARTTTVDGHTTLTVTNAATTLTDEGAAAFSNYPAGTTFDPISFTVTAPATCLASTPPAQAAPDVPAAPTPAESTPGQIASSSVPVWATALGGAGLGSLLTAAGAFLVMRRRPSAPAQTSEADA